MIVNNSQNIQSSNPLGSISRRGVAGEFRSSNPLSDDSQAQKAQQQQDTSVIRQLRARDREVRAHEAAHVAAGGSLVRGGPSFSYQTGPDGRAYAIGGEVQIDASAVPNNPEATLVKSSQIRAAALAPANPSPQDLRVAANASQLASRARVDIAIQRREDALSENEQAAESVQAEDAEATQAGSVNAGNNIENGGAVDTVPVVNSVTGSASLQTNDEPIAAINSFLTPPQTVSSPALFSQFA